jgi:hypothetical protein
MKSVVKENPVPALAFPCLLVSQGSDIIVLFTEDSTGTVVSGNGAYRVGEFCKTWNMNTFKPFSGTVTLSND